MELILEIYAAIVDKYIYYISENEFNNFFNLISTETTPVIKGRNKEKMYYLLSKMEETIKETDKKKHWISTISSLFGFKEKTYSKNSGKSKNISSRTENVEEFADMIDEIFKKYAD